MRNFLRSASAVAVALVASVGSVAAQLDLSGIYVHPQFTPVGPENCTLTIVQTGADVELEQACPLFVADALASGTVDLVTRELSVAGRCGFGGSLGLPYTYNLQATASADGRTLTGFDTCNPLFGGLSFPVHATKCGNGVDDVGEDCDSGPCCAADCRFDVGAICGASACGAGTCDSTGTCVDDTPFAAGTPCRTDDDNCTLEQCDGAGNCAVAGSVVCDGCSVCNEAGECDYEARFIGSSGPLGCMGPVRRESRLLMSSRDGVNRLKWDYGWGYLGDVALFGDPTATTGYDLCVFYQGAIDQPWRIAAAAHAEPGPGWQSRPNGLRFANRSAPHGLAQVRLRVANDSEQTRIVATARGENLIFDGDPGALDLDVPGARFQVELRADTGACWGALFRPFPAEIKKQSEHILKMTGGG